MTLLRVAKGLEQRGFIVRHAPLTGRRLSLHLTAAGESLFQQARPLAAQALQRLQSPLSATEQATLNHLLNKLCDALESDARAEMVPPQQSRSLES